MLSCPMPCLGSSCQMPCRTQFSSSCWCCYCLLHPFPTWCRSSGLPCSAVNRQSFGLSRSCRTACHVGRRGIGALRLVLGVRGRIGRGRTVLRAVRLCLLILRLGVAICIASRSCATTGLTRGVRRPSPAVVMRIAPAQAMTATMAMAIEKTMTFFCVWLRSRRRLGAQAAGGDARRGRASRNLAHLLRGRGAT